MKKLKILVLLIFVITLNNGCGKAWYKPTPFVEVYFQDQWDTKNFDKKPISSIVNKTGFKWSFDEIYNIRKKEKEK